jgi:hypothetical protein
MRTSFRSQPERQTRLFVRLSEFSFESYPVLVNHSFRAVPVSKNSPGKWCHLCQSVLKAVGSFSAPDKKLAARQKFAGARRSIVTTSQF